MGIPGSLVNLALSPLQPRISPWLGIEIPHQAIAHIAKQQQQQTKKATHKTQKPKKPCVTFITEVGFELRYQNLSFPYCCSI